MGEEKLRAFLKDPLQREITKLDQKPAMNNDGAANRTLI